MEFQTIKLRLNRRTVNTQPIAVTSQADRVISKFGGAYQTAAAIGYRPSTVYRWNYTIERGGSNGSVPTGAMKKLLAAARVHGIFLTGDDLYPGRR